MKKKSQEIAPRSIRRVFPQIKTIIDAKHPIVVNVTSKDCSNAISLDSSSCALARATKRELKADAVVIGLSTSYVIKGSKAIRFNSGQRVAREIVSFDRHHDFEPGSYTLSPKPKSMRFNEVKPGSKKSHGDNHKPVRVIHNAARVRLLSSKSGVKL